MSKFAPGDFGKDEEEYESVLSNLHIQTRIHYIIYCHGESREDMVTLPFYQQGEGGGENQITFEQLVDPGECLFSHHHNLFDLCREGIRPKESYRSGDQHYDMQFSGQGNSMGIFKCFNGPDGKKHLAKVRLILETEHISLLDMINNVIYQYHRTNHPDISSFKIIFHTCRKFAGSDVVISKPPITVESPDELADMFKKLGVKSDEMEVDKGGFAGSNKKKIRKFTKRKRKTFFSKKCTKKYKKVTKKYKKNKNIL